MAIKLIFKDKILNFSTKLPVDEQLKGCDRVKIDFDPEDKTIEYFLDELEKMAVNGSSRAHNIKVTYNNDIRGAKTNKKVKKIKEMTEVNNLIKMISTNYEIVDRKLEEIHAVCSTKSCKK